MNTESTESVNSESMAKARSNSWSDAARAKRAATLAKKKRAAKREAKKDDKGTPLDAIPDLHPNERKARKVRGVKAKEVLSFQEAERNLLSEAQVRARVVPAVDAMLKRGRLVDNRELAWAVVRLLQSILG